jgi:hypothetical protein
MQLFELVAAFRGTLLSGGTQNPRKILVAS